MDPDRIHRRQASSSSSSSQESLYEALHETVDLKALFAAVANPQQNGPMIQQQATLGKKIEDALKVAPQKATYLAASLSNDQLKGKFLERLSDPQQARKLKKHVHLARIDGAPTSPAKRQQLRAVLCAAFAHGAKSTQMGDIVYFFKYLSDAETTHVLQLLQDPAADFNAIFLKHFTTDF